MYIESACNLHIKNATLPEPTATPQKADRTASLDHGSMSLAATAEHRVSLFICHLPFNIEPVWVKLNFKGCYVGLAEVCWKKC